MRSRIVPSFGEQTWCWIFHRLTDVLPMSV